MNAWKNKQMTPINQLHGALPKYPGWQQSGCDHCVTHSHTPQGTILVNAVEDVWLAEGYHSTVIFRLTQCE
jgi:hypothetical protein